MAIDLVRSRMLFRGFLPKSRKRLSLDSEGYLLFDKLNLSDFHVPAPTSGGRKARPYERLVNLLGTGGGHPHPHRADRYSNLPIWRYAYGTSKNKQ